MYMYYVLLKDPNSCVYLKIHPNDLKQTFDAKKNQKEEYDNEWWKATFDYISQNAEYKNEIINSQPKLERSQRIRKANPKYFILDYVQ